MWWLMTHHQSMNAYTRRQKVTINYMHPRNNLRTPIENGSFAFIIQKHYDIYYTTSTA